MMTDSFSVVYVHFEKQKQKIWSVQKSISVASVIATSELCPEQPPIIMCRVSRFKHIGLDIKSLEPALTMDKRVSRGVRRKTG